MSFLCRRLLRLLQAWYGRLFLSWGPLLETAPVGVPEFSVTLPPLWVTAQALCTTQCQTFYDYDLSSLLNPDCFVGLLFVSSGACLSPSRGSDVPGGFPCPKLFCDHKVPEFSECAFYTPKRTSILHLWSCDPQKSTCPCLLSAAGLASPSWF